MTFRIAAVAAALVCLAPAAHAEERETVTVRVSHAGLDLSTAAGRRTLDARVDRAAWYACRPARLGLDGLRDANRCRAEMRADAKIRVARLMANDPVKVAAVR